VERVLLMGDRVTPRQLDVARQIQVAVEAALHEVILPGQETWIRVRREERRSPIDLGSRPLFEHVSTRGPVTPEELEARGWEGASGCRCLTEDGYVPCPPQLCEAQALLEKLGSAYRYRELQEGLPTGTLAMKLHGGEPV
jgi:hypothetical protein